MTSRVLGQGEWRKGFIGGPEILRRNHFPGLRLVSGRTCEPVHHGLRLAHCGLRLEPAVIVRMPANSAVVTAVAEPILVDREC